jgi:predicted ATPase
MLIDRGGDIESLEVPETLHALIAARLDDLGPTERRVIEDASVLGKSFTKPGLAALTGMDEAELEPILAALVRKDLLTLQADPRSPERGNYTFLQALVQRIAHDTLSRKEQKARHLAAARYFEQTWGADEAEIVEVIAAHYLDAYRADPEAPDAPEIRSSARDALVRAARRARSLAATEQAQSYFEQAAALAEDQQTQAELLEQAGSMAESSGRPGVGVKLFEQSISLFTSEDRSHDAARVEAKLASVLWDAGEIDTAGERMARSFEILRDDEPDQDLAMLAAQLARIYWFTGHPERSVEPLEFALEIAESLFLPDVLSEALNTKNLLLINTGRRQEGEALLRHALLLAQEHGIQTSAFRAQFNLSYHISGEDRYEEALELDRDALEQARRRGDRGWAWAFLGHIQGGNYLLGNWEELEETDEEITERLEGGTRARLDVIGILPRFYLNTGRFDRMQWLIDRMVEPSAEVQDTAGYALAHISYSRAEGRLADALARADEILAMQEELGYEHPMFRLALVDALELGYELGDFDDVTRRLEEFRQRRPADQLPFGVGQARRFEALLAARSGDNERAEERFRASAEILREISARFYLAVVLLEHGEWRVESGTDDAEPLLTEAREIFERLGAAPWLERMEAIAEPALKS